MKTLYLLTALLSLYLALCIEDKTHYLWARYHPSNVYLTFATTPSTAENQRTKDKQADIDYHMMVVPSPPDAPPMWIKVGAHMWSVTYVAHAYMNAANMYAFEENQDHRIFLDRQRNPVEIREDVLHEIMHAAFHEAKGTVNVESNLTENDFIKPTAPVFRDVLVDNPELLKWLLKAGG